MYKSFFAHLRQQWIDWFTSNQDQNDQRSIVHISSNTFHQRKWFVFVIICDQSYPRERHVAAATWLCTYLLQIPYSVVVIDILTQAVRFYRTPAHLVMSIMRDMVILSVCRFWSLDTLVGVVAKQLNVSSKFFLPSDSYNFLVSLELNIVTKFGRVFRPASRCV